MTTNFTFIKLKQRFVTGMHMHTLSNTNTHLCSWGERRVSPFCLIENNRRDVSREQKGGELHTAEVSSCCSECNMSSLLPTTKSTGACYAELALLLPNFPCIKEESPNQEMYRNAREKKVNCGFLGFFPKMHDNTIHHRNWWVSFTIVFPLAI